MYFLLRYCMLLCSGLLFYGSVQSQSYLPMLEEDKEWMIVYYCHAFMCGPLDVQYYHIYLDGDSIIGGQTYKRAKAEYRSFNYPWGSPFTFGWMREDTSSGQVFKLVDCSSSGATPTEQLLFDFSLNVGDTMSNCSDSTIVCTGVQTITTTDGKQRREVMVEHDFLSAPKKMIEGIGGEYYPWSLVPLGFVDSMIIECVTNNEINIYGNCNVVTHTPEPVAPMVSTYSTGEEQVFDFPPFRKARTLHIYNLQGKLLAERSIPKTGGQIIIPGLGAGIFIYGLQDTDLILSKKFIRF